MKVVWQDGILTWMYLSLVAGPTPWAHLQDLPLSTKMGHLDTQHVTGGFLTFDISNCHTHAVASENVSSLGCRSAHTTPRRRLPRCPDSSHTTPTSRAQFTGYARGQLFSPLWPKLGVHLMFTSALSILQIANPSLDKSMFGDTERCHHLVSAGLSFFAPMGILSP